MITKMFYLSVKGSITPLTTMVHFKITIVYLIIKKAGILSKLPRGNIDNPSWSPYYWGAHLVGWGRIWLYSYSFFLFSPSVPLSSSFFFSLFFSVCPSLFSSLFTYIKPAVWSLLSSKLGISHSPVCTDGHRLNYRYEKLTILIV